MGNIWKIFSTEGNLTTLPPFFQLGNQLDGQWEHHLEENQKLLVDKDGICKFTSLRRWNTSNQKQDTTDPRFGCFFQKQDATNPRDYCLCQCKCLQFVSKPFLSIAKR